MDTTKLEYTAEDLIAHSLQRGGLLVAKPKFDRDGADLLAFNEINDGVKFCRIQSKGRSFSNSKHSNVRIPKSYVTPSFILFLYIDEGDFEESNLYYFFSSDLEKWNCKDEYFTLNISKSNYKTKLSQHEFNKNTVELIKTVINTAETHGEFKKLVSLAGECSAKLSITATLSM